MFIDILEASTTARSGITIHSQSLKQFHPFFGAVYGNVNFLPCKKIEMMGIAIFW